MTKAIKVSDLTHSYTSGQTLMRVLDAVCLEVSAGQTVALIGRSGSGKSTLLNLVSGLEPISEGDVSLNGQSMKQMNDRQRTLLRGQQIGFIYQSFNLIPTLTVHDNMALPMALSGVADLEQRKRIDELLQAVGLPDRSADYPDRLSGGEQQRVAIGRALAHKPALILADEPTGNLDAESGRQVLQLLMQLVSEQQSAMLLVTHSVEVARLADQVLILDQGVISELSGDALTDSAAW